ncbi:hypothetical protein KKF69_05260 [Patescibacteria group bacterium]|nr:hypothetical protein [Patescibacteria group bacterium]
MTTLPVLLSSWCDLRVKNNDPVKAGQLIAQKILHKECAINIANEFFESCEKARRYITKKPGDNIKAGDILAIKKNFFGFKEKKVISRVDGIFSRYARDTGNLFITLMKEEGVTDIVSPVDGIVTLCNNDKIVIETDKDVYRGRKGAGGNAQGEVFILEGAFEQNGIDSEESEISLYYTLDSRAVGKIIVGKNFQRDLLIKCIGMGVVGIVGTGISNSDLEYISGRHMQVPLIEVDSDIIKRILKWKNKKIYLNSQEKLLILLHA